MIYNKAIVLYRRPWRNT